MTDYPTTRFVFDRKNTATNEKKALIQVEILFQRKKKYISTGVKVFKNQYNKKEFVCNCFEMVALNKRINAVKERIDNFISSLMEKNEPFTFEKLESFLDYEDKKEMKFLEYILMRIDQRNDIRDSTKKNHKKLINSLEQYGKIIYFSDLTKKNIIGYDEFLHQQNIKQTTICSYHKFMKTYIHDAIKHELISADPYIGIKIVKGESEIGRFLSEKEFQALKAAELPTESLKKVRDLFVIQCLTGLSFSDLMNFDFSRIEEIDGHHYINAKRNKTGIEYCAVLLPDVMEIVKRYGDNLPKFSIQQYNMRLKLIADYAGINKDIASHWGRRTCGMLLLNRGVSMEVVSKVLGHSSIRTTESVYAKLLPKRHYKIFCVNVKYRIQNRVLYFLFYIFTPKE